MTHTAKHGHGHGHNHEHNHSGKAAISRVWQVAAVTGNAAIGALELVTGAGASGASTMAVVGDGLHNLGDAATYWAQTNDVRKGIAHGGEAETKRRRFIFSAIAASSLWVAVQGGMDIAQHDEHNSDHNDLALAAAGASVALNGMLAAHLVAGTRRTRNERGGNHCQHENDLLTHIAIDSFSAVAGLAGAVAQRYNFDIAGVGIDNAAAMASGVVGAWAFRPTTSNLSHIHEH